jgi:peptide-methionine (S)-S-oxide reductase
MEDAIFGAGCFWGLQAIFRTINGVSATEVGYCGGNTSEPTYQEVCAGKTGHAEVIRVTFDPEIVSYRSLLEYFFKMHDPTTVDRQHNDIGPQYRSCIYYYNNDQKIQAEEIVKELTEGNFFREPIVTQLEMATKFYIAEEHHQDYLEKNPNGYMCHVLRSNYKFE